MPSIEWNRKWERMITEFEASDDEPHFGDRWGDPETFEPLLAVRKRFVDPYVRPGQTILEIGSGGGRLTQFLLDAARLIVVDLNLAVFEYLRGRFADHLDKIQFYQTSGYEMAGIPDASVDLVFTFDVFVHVEPEGIGQYLQEIERVLKPGGRAVVHYGDIRKKIARDNPGFSRMTQAKMEALLATTNLAVLKHDTEVMFHSNLVALEK